MEKEDLFTNPALFISSYKGYMDKIRVNGSSSNSLDVTLVLDEDTSARFVLKNIVFEDKQGKSDFTLNVKSLPDSGQARKKRLHAEREIASRFVCDHRSAVDSFKMTYQSA